MKAAMTRFVVGLFLLELTGCHAMGSTDSLHAGAWTITSLHVDTTITSRTTQRRKVDLKFEPLSSSHKQRTAIVAFTGHGEKTLVLDKSFWNKWTNSNQVPVMVVPHSNEHGLEISMIQWVPSDGTGKKEVRFSTVPIKNTSNTLSWLVVPKYYGLHGGSLHVVAHLRLHQDDGYFTSFSIHVDRKSLIQNVSGCVNVANNLPYAKDFGKGMITVPNGTVDSGFHGWCYRNRNFVDPHITTMHYIDISTAPSWASVVGWEKKAFAEAEASNFSRLATVANELQLGSNEIGEKEKVHKIQIWIHKNLKYSNIHSKAHVPNHFDDIVRSGGGDCKDLVLVMVMLMHTARIEANPALTSTTQWHPFRLSSGNLSPIDHIVVHIPAYHYYVDATANGVHAESYLAIQQVMDIVTGDVLEPSKLQILPLAGR